MGLDVSDYSTSTSISSSTSTTEQGSVGINTEGSWGGVVWLVGGEGVDWGAIMEEKLLLLLQPDVEKLDVMNGDFSTLTWRSSWSEREAERIDEDGLKIDPKFWRPVSLSSSPETKKDYF